MVKLIPSILNADFYCLKEQFEILKAQNIDTLHIDVMDGHFVDNISFAFPILESIKDKGFALDIHLMIENPERYIKRFCKYGSIVTIHYETTNKPAEILQHIRQNNTKAGIAINPDTDVNLLYPLIGKFDLALIMSVFPGYGGQEFMIKTLEKAQKLHAIKQKNNFLLEIDGGINFDNIIKVKKYGFDMIVIGSTIMKGNLKENIEKIGRLL
jgi:ribulose-phosphate 3-epimerase